MQIASYRSTAGPTCARVAWDRRMENRAGLMRRLVNFDLLNRLNDIHRQFSLITLHPQPYCLSITNEQPVVILGSDDNLGLLSSQSSKMPRTSFTLRGHLGLERVGQRDCNYARVFWMDHSDYLRVFSARFLTLRRREVAFVCGFVTIDKV
ncbi:hypothetical protein BDQ17DRAFT_208146 [Cyathus striatus]|nr:hypothetical protein BDQ17DRAFT_208146 [Cyathus striatus]